MDNEYNLHERVAVLESKLSTLDDIENKLDSLLDLKNKGLGAIWFVSLIFGSGLLGLIATLISWFNRPHL